MTREEFSQIAMGLRSLYSNPEFIKDKFAFDMWYSFLSDYEYQEVSDAVRRFIATDTKGFAPSIGQIIDNISKNTGDEYLGEGEAWALVMKALSNSSYHADEEYAKLPPLVQKAIGSPGNMRNLAKAEDFNEQVEHSLFRRSYEAYVNRAKEDAKLPDYLKKGVGICAEQNQMIEQSE